jgi:hypothetical protein
MRHRKSKQADYAFISVKVDEYSVPVTLSFVFACPEVRHKNPNYLDLVVAISK